MEHSKKLVLLVLMALMLVVLNSDGQVMAPTLAIIEKEFGVSDAAVGVMMGLFTVLGAIVSLLWGYFADKASRKLLFVLSVLIGELPCALTAFAPNWTVFFFLRILTGIGMGAAFPLVFSILGDIYDEKERPWASAILTVSFGMGNIVGGVLGGFVGASGNWRFPFLLAALPNIPLVLLFWLLVPEPKAAASEEATKALVEAGLVYPRRIRLSDYTGLFKIKTNVYLLIQGIAGTIPWGSFFFLNKFLNEYKGLSIAEATTVYLVFGVGMVIGTIVGGIWGGAIFKKSDTQLPIFCAETTFLGTALTLGVVLLKLPLAIIIPMGFFAAFFAAMTGPNMRTMLLDVNVPESRGPIFSIFNLTDSLGTGFGRFVAGFLSVAFGLMASLSISVSFWIFCGIVLWFTSSIFPPDRQVLKATMSQIAEEMKQKNAY
ncbi:MAG TPA: MFS transporter [Treponema sp.]|nr:MFS transporter [Treponema sp.]HON14361.1 MFS transporter [Treponema sp.]